MPGAIAQFRFLDAQQTDAAMRSPLEPCCDWGQSNLHFRLFRLWPIATYCGRAVTSSLKGVKQTSNGRQKPDENDIS